MLNDPGSVSGLGDRLRELTTTVLGMYSAELVFYKTINNSCNFFNSNLKIECLQVVKNLLLGSQQNC